MDSRFTSLQIETAQKEQIVDVTGLVTDAVKAAGIGLLITGMVSEQMMTATSAGPFWLLLGMIGTRGALQGAEPSRRAA